MPNRSPLVSLPFRDLGAVLLTLAVGLGTAWSADTASLLVLSELCAVNETAFRDEDGQRSDWIEIHNRSTERRSLSGYFLTDAKKKGRKWAFPEVEVEAGGYLVVFASGKDRASAGGELHTNFKLSGEGEYVALRSAERTLDSVSFPAQVPGGSFARFGNDWGYSRRPSPGEENAAWVPTGGPGLSDIAHVFVRHGEGVGFRVTAKLTGRAESPRGIEAQLHYRVMFAPEATVAMRDDGIEGDREAGDAIFTATVSAEQLARLGLGEGGLIQYYLVSRDRAARTSARAPRFLSMEGAEYFGAVRPHGESSKLPVLHWFMEDPREAHRRSGGAASLVFRGEYYDKVHCRIRGGTSTMWEKQSFKFEFPKAQHFLFDPEVPRVSEFNLNTTVQDKAYLRETLAYELYRDAGVPAPLAANVRVERNGVFYCVSTLVEQIDTQFLQRHGLSREGLLYKASDSRPEVMHVESKGEREDWSALLELFSVADSQEQLEASLFRQVDLPGMINYLAAGTVMRDWDRPFHNYYLYCPPEGKWTMFPWDKDLTLGEHWQSDHIEGGGRFGHPFYGAMGRGKDYHPVYDAIVRHPGTRRMYLRRLRTLMDRQLQAPGEAVGPHAIAARIDRMAARLAEEAALDLETWGSRVVPRQPRFIPFPEAIRELKERFLPERRDDLYRGHGPMSRTGIPEAQAPLSEILPKLSIVWKEDASSVRLANLSSNAVDLSGLELVGPRRHRFLPGTVLAPLGFTGWQLNLVPDGVVRGEGEEVLYQQRLDTQIRSRPVRLEAAFSLAEIEKAEREPHE